MRSIVRPEFGIVFALTLLFGAPVRARGAESPLQWEVGGTKLRLELNERIRGEFVDWFNPGPTSTTPHERYNFFASRTRVGLRIMHGDIEAFFQAQEAILANIPKASPGPGGVYRLNTDRNLQQEPVFKQGWVSWRNAAGLKGLSLMGGRFIYSDGAEVVPTNASLAWLTRQRISERLIGPFEYTHIGRAFDGAQVAYDAGPVVVTGLATHPTAGGFEISANRDLSEINLAGVAASAKEYSVLGGTAAGRVFWIYYGDVRDTAAKLDNRDAALREADKDDIQVHTVGLHELFVRPLGPGEIDGLAWVLGQVGDWGLLDHRAWAYTFELGYRFPDVPWTPWIRYGVFRSSGDDSPTDGKHDTFFQILPTARTYAQTPFYNLMNSTDLFTQLVLKPVKSVVWRTDAHWLGLTEKKDFLYSGGGATNRDVFGYAGIPSNGRRGVAVLLDTSISYAATSWLTLYGYYGHGFGQGVIDAAFQGKQLDFGYLEATVSY
jgi:hypothetical protein